MDRQYSTSWPPRRKKHRFLWTICIILVISGLLTGGFLLFLTMNEYRPAPIDRAAFGGNSECPEFDSDEFSICTLNIGYGSLGKDADFLMDGGKGYGSTDSKSVQRNMTGLCNILQKYKSDLYILQEIDLDSHRTGHMNQLETLRTVLPEYEWYYAPNFLCDFVPYPIQRPFGPINSGIATYSRYHAAASQRISLPVPFSWPIRTANLKRCLLTTRIPISGSEKELVIINFHLEAYDNGEGKQAQTDQLLNLLHQEYEKGNYVVAGGDFNQIFPQVETEVKSTSQWVPGKLDPLPEDWDGWQYAYDDSIPTCRLLNQPHNPQNPLTQYYVIDGYIVSPNLGVKEVKTHQENFEFTDHNPVTIQVSLKDS